MKIIDFTHVHIKEASALALSNYEEERRFVSALPLMESVPDLTRFADNGLGIAAFDGDKMAGFLCSVNPIVRPFQIEGILGAYSPLHAHGAILENRAAIYEKMYQAAAEKWVKAGATNHAIVCYAHDTTAQMLFFRHRFGLNGIDAICQTVTHSVISGDMAYAEISINEIDNIAPLHHGMVEHFKQSPMFVYIPHSTADELKSMYQIDNIRYFVARKNNETIAYLKISGHGETFVSIHPHMQNICGAYCLPEYRGLGIMQSLLNFTISILNSEGFSLVGVDFESFNPTAYGFWLKYFTPYTHGLVRRI